MDHHNPLLYSDDVETIRGGRLLGATPLYVALEALVARRPGTVVLDPNRVYASGLDRSVHGDQTVAELRAQVDSVRGMGGRVFIPLLVSGGRHYILAVANFANRTIKFYDSAADPRRPNHNVLRIVARIIPPSAPGEEPWDRGFFASIRQQNGRDCGVSCFLNVVHSLNHPDASDLTDLPDMPAYLVRPGHGLERPAYWTAARAVIMSLCSLKAIQDSERKDGQERITRVVNNFTRTLGHVNTNFNAERRRQEAEVLAWVTAEITNLNGNNDDNALVRDAIAELVRLNGILPVTTA